MENKNIDIQYFLTYSRYVNGFLKKVFNSVVSPSHSRTALILIGLIIFAAIPLTVIVSQQQQNLKQKATEKITSDEVITPSSNCDYLHKDINSCLADSNCAWGVISPFEPFCTELTGQGRGFTCPSGYSEWYWRKNSSGNPVNECAPTPTLTPTITPARTSSSEEPAGIEITDIAIANAPGGFVNATITLSQNYASCLASKCIYKDGSTSVEASSTCDNAEARPAKNVVVNPSFRPTQPNEWSLISCSIFAWQQPQPLATLTKTLTLPPSQTGYMDCQDIYVYSDVDCKTQVGSFPSGCKSPQIYASKTGCNIADNVGVSGSKSYRVRSCQPCTPSQTNPNVPTQTAVSPTKTPTPTPIKDTVLSLQFKLQGIAAKTLHKRIKYTVTIFDQQKNKVKEIEGIVDDFDDVSNIFKASLVINESNKVFPTGNYFVKVKVNKNLVKQVSAPVTITFGTTNNIAAISPVIGDMNADNKIDIQDYNVLAGCFGKKAELSSCTNKTAAYTGETGTIYNADLNDDGVVDGIDYNTFIRNFNLEGD